MLHRRLGTAAPFSDSNNLANLLISIRIFNTNSLLSTLLSCLCQLYTYQRPGELIALCADSQHILLEVTRNALCGHSRENPLATVKVPSWITRPIERK